MKIAIVGAGAMGSLFGGLLAERGTDIQLLDIWTEHVQAINSGGLCVEHQGTGRSIEVNATTDWEAIGRVDLAVIFVKSIHTGAAAETAARLLDAQGLALTLQNGLGNADVIAEHIAPDRILAGTTSHGATLLEPGKIRHAGVGPTLIGSWSGGDEKAAGRVAETFSAAGIDTQAVDNVRSLIWDKLLINVGINAITALTGINNGGILEMEATRSLSRIAVQEAMAVARARGVAVREDAVEHVFEVAAATAGNRSSMGQDVDHGRPTEIGMINGAVVREAESTGVRAPVNKTLTALVETLQAHYR